MSRKQQITLLAVPLHLRVEDSPIGQVVPLWAVSWRDLLGIESALAPRALDAAPREEDLRLNGIASAGRLADQLCFPHPCPCLFPPLLGWHACARAIPFI